MNFVKLALAVAALLPLASYAALGAAPGTRTPRVRSRSCCSRRFLDCSAAAASYTMREANGADGVTIHEYVLPSNVVFAVTWQGPVRPDMSELLGSYFPNFTNAGDGRARGVGPMVEHNGDFHIESAGRAGAFSARRICRASFPPMFAWSNCNEAARGLIEHQHMTTLNKTLCCALLGASVALSACGGGGGDDGSANAAKNNDKPATPTSNTESESEPRVRVQARRHSDAKSYAESESELRARVRVQAQSNPKPKSEPSPSSNTDPDPTPTPRPTPSPTPSPTPTPDPNANPNSNSKPQSNPNPNPNPDSTPTTNTAPITVERFTSLRQHPIRERHDLHPGQPGRQSMHDDRSHAGRHRLGRRACARQRFRLGPRRQPAGANRRDRRSDG